jgi:isopenicillin-N epimerase
MTITFGRPVRSLWGLAEDVTFLNHGSFGACPLEVLKQQDMLRAEMERQPDVFFREKIMPRESGSPLRDAVGEVASFVHANASDVVFVENATAGIQAVLRSMKFAPGDRILITNHTYNAMRLMVETRCAETGATPLVVQIPVPTTWSNILARFRDALTPATKLAIIDHIASPTALIFPLREIIALLRNNGTRILVDGAHAIGQIPLDIGELAPDWYVSNMHKWLFAPKGSAFLYASPAVARETEPNIVSHFIKLGFPHSFDYTGTRDNTAWLATPAALKFFQGQGPEAIRAYQRRLIAHCRDLLSPLGIMPVGPDDMSAAMRSFILPQNKPAAPEDGPALMLRLWNEERIQISAVTFDQMLLIRISAQVYVTEDDMRHFAATLDRVGWPNRA